MAFSFVTDVSFDVTSSGMLINAGDQVDIHPPVGKNTVFIKMIFNPDPVQVSDLGVISVTPLPAVHSQGIGCVGANTIACEAPFTQPIFATAEFPVPAFGSHNVALFSEAWIAGQPLYSGAIALRIFAPVVVGPPVPPIVLSNKTPWLVYGVITAALALPIILERYKR